MSGFTLWYRGDDLTLANVGYAELNEPSGIYLDNEFKNSFDKYRMQLYDKIVIKNGKVDSMEGKTLLETGCGRGGGLFYLSQIVKPHYVIGVDMTYTQVGIICYYRSS